MSDLVERLREGTTIRLSETAASYTPPPKLQIEAADRIEALERALKPFAEYMGDMDRDNLGNPLPDDAGVGWVYLKQADFRAARRALSEPDKDAT